MGVAAVRKCPPVMIEAGSSFETTEQPRSLKLCSLSQFSHKSLRLARRASAFRALWRQKNFLHRGQAENSHGLHHSPLHRHPILQLRRNPGREHREQRIERQDRLRSRQWIRRSTRWRDSVHAKHSIQFCAIECADATLLNDGLAVIWRRKINELTSPSIVRRTCQVQRSKFLGSAK